VISHRRARPAVRRSPEHVADDLEAVVKEYPHFWLVEKHGEAGEVAKKLT
jgi:hypothetical protein